MTTFFETDDERDETDSLSELLRLVAGGAYDRSDAAAVRLWQEAA